MLSTSLSELRITGLRDRLINSLCLSLLLLGATALGMNPSYAKATEDRLLNREQLIEAAKSGNLAEVERLIAQGASVDAKDNYGWTPLHWAAAKGHEAVCKLLIANNASVEAKNNYGLTPLHYAAGNGHEAMCKLLIENKASVDAKNNHGWTPLYCAAANGHEAICKLLIANKASVEAKNNIGSPPLYYAARNGHEAVCKLLIDMQLKVVRKNKAAIVTFLGIARKRAANLPCQMQKDVAIMIARQALETVQRDKQPTIIELNKIRNPILKAKLLAHVKQQMNSVNK